MKKLAEQRWGRTLAVVLFFVFSLMSTAASAVVTYGRDAGWYQMGNAAGFENTYACRNYVYDAIWYVSENIIWLDDLESDGLGSYAGEAFSYVVRDGDGHIRADTRTDHSVFITSIERTLTHEDEGEVLQSEELFTVEGYVNLPVEPYQGCYAEYMLYESLFGLRYTALALKYVFLALAAASAAVLCFAAFRRGREGDLRPFRRKPWDLVLVGLVAVYNLFFWAIDSSLWRVYNDGVYMATGVFMVTGMQYYSYYWILFRGAKYFLLLCACLLGLWYAAGQLGAGILWDGLWVRRVYRRIPREAYVVGVAAVHILLLLMVESSRLGYSPLLLIGFDVLAAGFLLLYFRQAARVCRAAEELTHGNLEYKTDVNRLHFIWRTLGERLNSIGDGMAEAVEDRMRSERMKTELITNVSHDLKTPLTSIINYVDFLKNPDLAPETRAEYLAILDKQSARLKKLTEDVVEASKAASGAMNVNREPIDMVELLEQFVGEYAGRMESAGVEPVLSAPEEPAVLEADSVLLGRVIDNLFSNVVKYAMPGTRTYIDLAREGEWIMLTVKNVSREPLNISAEELMERFVRGDSARHTEGSGLGLSIARSLAELMGGRLDLVLDGDLFKAVLSFESHAESEMTVSEK